MNLDIVVYKGNGLVKSSKKNRGKHFVFDLDETLGSFSDLYILYQCLDETHSNRIPSSSILVKQLLKLYPEFLRYGIATILQFLYHQKENNYCDGVHIYTNNQCVPDTWTFFITQFIEEHYSIPGLFGDIIRAFKINGKIVEKRRSMQSKSYRDLMKCIMIPPKTEICFIDDVMDPKIKNRYLYYLQPKPYFHELSKDMIINRFLNSQFGKTIVISSTRNTIYDWYQKKGYCMTGFLKCDQDIETDIAVSKKLMYHIREFFRYKKKETNTRKQSKKHVSSSSKTMKLRNE